MEHDDAPPAPVDEHPLSAPEPPAAGAKVVVPRWIQAVLLPLALLGAWALARAAGPVLLLFVIAGLIALLLNPFVTVLRRRAHLPRGLAVLLTYLFVIGALGTAGTLLAGPIGDQVSIFRANVPRYIDEANLTLADTQAWLDDHNVAIEISKPGETALQSLGNSITRGSGSLVDFTRDALTILVEASLAVILIIVLSVYMLLYGERIGTGVRRIVPPGDGSPEDDFPTRLQKAVFGYVRGQLLFSTIMGVSAGLMLYVLGSAGIFPEGKTYAVFFGVFYGLAELIPYVGPAIGAAPPLLIALFGPQPLDALWLTIGFTALQQIEGHIVAPNVFAQALRINPIFVIAALLLGGRLYGFIGAFISLPIAAMLRETVVYMRRHLVLEPWPRTMEPALAGAGLGVVANADPPSERGPTFTCAECGAPVPAGAAECPSCGTEVADPGAQAAATSSAPG
jgi:predicted PurR-regulated permease PerM